MWPPQLMKGSLHCDLLSYWFNRLSPPSCACSYTRSMSSLWLLLLQTNPISPQTAAPLSHNTSLISLCLMSGTKGLTSRGKSRPSSHHFTQSWHIDLPKAVMEASRLADDCQLKCSLWWHPWRQLEPQSHCTCRDFKAITLHGNVYLNESLSKNANCGRKTVYVAWKIEWVQCSDTNTTVYLVLVNFPNSTDYDKARWKKSTLLNALSLISKEHPQVK